MKTIICGVGKIQNDFQYIFQDFEVAGYIRTENSLIYDSTMIIVEYDYLRDLEIEETRIIICDREKEKCREKIEKYGYVYGANLYYADDFFDSLDYPLQEIVKGRELVIWGTGTAKENTLEVLKEYLPEVKISFYIDNNPKKVNGKQVFSFADAELNDKFVIVASGWYKEIRCDLMDRGLIENQDFIDYQKIYYRPSQMLTKTIYDIPITDNHCMWPFEEVNIQIDNVYACGWPTWLTTPIGSEFSDDLKSIWNSNVARVIRLSMLNHTYSFCEKSTCPYLDLEPTYEKDYVFDRKNVYAMETPKKPKRISISYDEVCNLKCLSCRKEGIYHNSGNLNRTLEKVTDDLKTTGWLESADAISVAGNGEVFYSDLYKDLIFTVDEKRDSILIQTNGTLIQEEYLKKLSEKYHYIEFYISIDAATADTFKMLRTGSWKALTNGLQLLANYRAEDKVNRVRLSFVVQKDNYKEIPSFVQMAKKYGFDWIYFSRIQNFAGWEEKEYWEKSMIRKDGTIKEELLKIFEDPDVWDEIADFRQFYRNLEVSGCEHLIKERKETVFWKG